MKRRILTLLCWTFTSCALAFACPSSAAASGHLYVVGHNGTIERFPLTNGLPAPAPDLTFPQKSYAFTASEGGTFYAQTSAYHIDAFALGSIRPERRIDFPKILGCGTLIPSIEALATDPQGNLYVTISAYFSGARTPLPRYGHVKASGENLPCVGYLVYGPHATGHAGPFFFASIGGQYLPSVSVDGSGHLYVVDTAMNAAERYTAPLSRPTLDASFNIGNNQYTLAVDFAGRMLVDYIDRHDNFHVARFPAGAPNQSQPSNDFQPNNGSFAVATRGCYVYVCDAFVPEVEVYPATANGGPQQPVLTLPLPADCDFVATGV